MTEFTYDRRTFLRRGAMGAGALWALSLDPFIARRAEGAAIPSPVRTDQPEDRRDHRPSADQVARRIPLHVFFVDR